MKQTKFLIPTPQEDVLHSGGSNARMSKGTRMKMRVLSFLLCLGLLSFTSLSYSMGGYAAIGDSIPVYDSIPANDSIPGNDSIPPGDTTVNCYVGINYEILSVTQDTGFMKKATVTFMAIAPQNTQKFLWSFSNGDTAAYANPTLDFYFWGNTITTAELKIVTLDGCVNATSMIINNVSDSVPSDTTNTCYVDFSHKFLLVESDGEGYTKAVVSFMANAPKNTESFVWNFSNWDTATYANPTKTFYYKGDLVGTAKLTIKTFDGCVNSISKTLYYDLDSLPYIDSLPHNDTLCYIDFLYKIVDVTSPDSMGIRKATVAFNFSPSTVMSSYNWTFSNGDSLGWEDSYHDFYFAGDTVIKATLEGITLSGCYASVSKYVIYLPDSVIYNDSSVCYADFTYNIMSVSDDGMGNKKAFVSFDEVVSPNSYIQWSFSSEYIDKGYYYIFYYSGDTITKANLTVYGNGCQKTISKLIYETQDSIPDSTNCFANFGFKITNVSQHADSMGLRQAIVAFYNFSSPNTISHHWSFSNPTEIEYDNVNHGFYFAGDTITNATLFVATS